MAPAVPRAVSPCLEARGGGDPRHKHIHLSIDHCYQTFHRPPQCHSRIGAIDIAVDVAPQSRHQAVSAKVIAHVVGDGTELSC